MIWFDFLKKKERCYCRKHNRCRCLPEKILGLTVIVDPDMPKGTIALVGKNAVFLTNIGDEDDA